MTTLKDKRELRLLAMDIKLFLRMAALHFPATKDRLVIERLMEMADWYGAGHDVWNKQGDVSAR